MVVGFQNGNIVLLVINVALLTARDLTLQDLDEDLYVFSSNKWPFSIKEVPSIGNGHLATVVKQEWIHMNGLYNGHMTNSHRAKIPATNQVKLSGFCASNIPAVCVGRRYNWQKTDTTKYSLDTRTALFRERHSNQAADVTMDWFIHRTLAPLMAFKLSVDCHPKPVWPLDRTAAIGTFDPYSVVLDVQGSMQSEDIDFVQVDCPFENARCLKGTTKEAENEEFSGKRTFFMIFDLIPSNLTFHCSDPHNEWHYLSSIHYDQDTAFQAYRTGKLLARRGILERSNEEGWMEMWRRGRLEVEGRVQVARAAVASLFGLYISLPFPHSSPDNDFNNSPSDNRSNNSLRFNGGWEEDDGRDGERVRIGLREGMVEASCEEFIGLSPSGLSWGDQSAYQGHVFWDQEVWMYPPLLLFNKDIAKLILRTRIRTLAGAYHIAKEQGLKGVKYPWESAYSGLETGPYAPCNRNEIHINGDISLAFKSYLYMIGFNYTCSVDDVIGSRTSNLLIGIGDYWLSRVYHNEHEDRYEMHCVMPPDEYHECVSNSAYTNTIALISLQVASLTAASLGLSNASFYQEVASKMYVPFDSERQYHPEYDGFTTDTKIKQADAILLNFPLMSAMNDSVRTNDLINYEPLTDTNGPAMSDSMYAVGWLSVAKVDEAATSFEKMFGHVNGDFQVWTESKGGRGAPNFITGMGGYLQALLFGYGGIRINPTHLSFNPQLPYNVTKMNIFDINYKSCVFDVSIGVDVMEITMGVEEKYIRKNIFEERSFVKMSDFSGVGRVNAVYKYEDCGQVVELEEGEKVRLQKRAGGIYVSWESVKSEKLN